MADDPTDEDFDEEEIDVDLDDEELAGDLEGDEDLGDSEETDDLDEEEAAADAALAARPKREDDDDDEDDINPDDVEADLDEILKDRIAAADEEEDDEEETVPEPRTSTEIAEGVTPKRANEFTCTGCFLLVNRGQFGPAGAMHCPVGEEDCPAIALIESGALDKPATRAATKKDGTASGSPRKAAAKSTSAKSTSAKAPAARKTTPKRTKG